MKNARELTYGQSIREALYQEMEKNENIILMGEDICSAGGSHGILTGLFDKFGPKRVLDTPISEAGFIGMGVGAAATGLRPVVELFFFDFFGVAGDQIINQAAKLRYMFGGKVKVPLTILSPFGGGLSFAAQHSQSFYSLFVHIPGLKVVAPSTPYDAKGLLTATLRQDDPTFFLEHKYLINKVKGFVPEESYIIPLGKADIKKEGSDVTIVGIARTTLMALEAASILEKEKIHAEVVDLRTLSPLDEQTILKSVQKTGKLVVVDEDNPRCSMATEISALVADKAFKYLTSPIKLVTSPHSPVPFSFVLEEAYLPNTDKIVRAIKEIL